LSSKKSTQQEHAETHVTISGELAGKGIVISGAARGLGREYAFAVAKEGAKVALIDVDDNVKETAESIRLMGGSAIYFQGDIRKNEQVQKFSEIAVDALGRIDVLINNAAIYYGLVNKPFTDIPEEEWDRVMDVNVKGTWLMSKYFAQYMVKQGKGKIINVASALVFSGFPGLMHYTASKAAVVGMTRVMARELGPYGIRVNCIAPGLVTTEATLRRVSGNYIKQVGEETALKHVAEPKDIVGVVIFLASDKSDGMTGQTLIVDEGSVFV